MGVFVFSAGFRARAIILMMMVICLAASLVRADQPIVGQWDMKLDYQGNLIPAKLKFENKDGKLSGTWSSQRGTNELTNIKFENGKLSFTRSIQFQDQQFDLQYEGTVEGDKITGKFTTPMGDMEANGVRAAGEAPKGEPAKKEEKMPAKEVSKPAAVGDAKSIAGQWELTVDSPLGTNKRKLTITDDLKGTYEADFGKFETKNMKLDGSKLTFDLTLAVQGQELPLKFEGTVDGGNLKGALKSDQGEGQVTGKKAGAAMAAESKESKEPKSELLTGKVDLPGLWKMKIETPDGSTNEGKMEFKKAEGGKLVAVLSTEVGDVTVNEITVDGNKLDFKAKADLGGSEVPVVFKGSVGGDKIKGIASLWSENRNK